MLVEHWLQASDEQDMWALVHPRKNLSTPMIVDLTQEALVR